MKKLLSLILVFILILSNLVKYDSYGSEINESEYNYSGGSGTFSDPYIIRTAEDLKNISDNLNSSFIQYEDIDLKDKGNWIPIGSSVNPFNGSYNGNGYSISNMKINSAANDNIGLFGYTSTGAVIKNVRLISPDIDLSGTSRKFVGSLIGYNNGSTVESCSSINGSITAYYGIGGLIGVSKSSTVKNSFFQGTITALNGAEGKIGGLIGYVHYISENNLNLVENCYADSIINGGNETGGLIGFNTGIIKNSFSSGIVNGTSNMGALIGYLNEPSLGSIDNSYSDNSLTLVSGAHLIYGLIGHPVDNNYITSSFWNKDNTDSNLTNSSIILDSGVMKDVETYKSWDFQNTWNMDNGINEGYPFLRELPKISLNISGNFDVEDKTYDGTTDAFIKSSNLTLSGNYIPTDSSIILNPVATFNDENIGNDKIVDLTNSYLTGKYTFLYELDFTGSPSSSADIYEYVDYTKNYYIEKLINGEYEILYSKSETGLVREIKTIPSLTIHGFKENINHPESKIEGEISIDNPLVLRRFYDRNIYSVIFKDYDGRIINTQEVKYEANALLPENPYRSGYRFIGWSGNLSNIDDNEIITPLYRKKSRPKKVEIVEKIQVPSVENHWSKEAVEELVNKGIIVKYKNFKPEEKISRVEFADYITRALGIFKENNNYEINFTDIIDDYEYSDSIKSALEKGIIKGYEDGTFRPSKTITRQEAMVMYSRAIKVLNIEFDEFKPLGTYDDYYKLDDWSLEDVRKVITAGVFKGTEENKLSPSSTFKYSEAAESIRNLLYLN